jgi:hypothetical protein
MESNEINLPQIRIALILIQLAIDLQCYQVSHMFADFYNSRNIEIIHNSTFLCKCLRFSDCNNFNFLQLSAAKTKKPICEIYSGNLCKALWKN